MRLLQTTRLTAFRGYKVFAVCVGKTDDDHGKLMDREFPKRMVIYWGVRKL
jgi:hypothetical protein